MNKFIIALVLAVSFSSHAGRHSVSVMMSSHATERELLAERLAPVLAPIEATLGANFNPQLLLALITTLGGKVDMQDIETVALMKNYRNILGAIKALETPFVRLCREYAPELFQIDTIVANPLHFEARVPQKDNKPLVQKIIQLLKSGEVNLLELNEPLGQSGRTLLMVAAQHNDLALAGALIQKGAVQLATDGYNALLLAIDNAGPNNKGNPEMVQLLLNAGANPNSNEGKLGWTALMLAANRLNFVIMELLIKAGADVHAKDRGGSTAYQTAVATLKRHRQYLPAVVRELDRIFGLAVEVADAPPKRRERPAQVIPQSEETTVNEAGVEMTEELKALIRRFGNEVDILEGKLASISMTAPGYGVTVDALFQVHDFAGHRDEVRAVARAKGHRNVLNALQYLEINQGHVNANDPKGERICNVCFKITNKRCGGCETAYYCSAKCQHEDWKQHKPHCQKH